MTRAVARAMDLVTKIALNRKQISISKYTLGGAGYVQIQIFVSYNLY
jgi:hypothetical protein